MNDPEPLPSDKRPDRRSFFINIVSPTILAMAAFVALIFLIVIPVLERSIMERKREMIRELTASAWSLVAEFEQQARSGVLSRAQAQRSALERVQDLRYGHEGKDYFWITDMTPRMVMHPYVAELNGKDLSDYRDPHGKRLFVEFVEAVRAHGEGYVSYSWQWKDDATRIVPKLSYVRGFEPWGWIIGTGVYVEDVRQDIRGVTRHVAGVSLIIILGIAGLLTYQGRQGWLLEGRRRRAQAELLESEARYRALVEAATEGILMVLEGRPAYANPTLHAMLGYDAQAFAALRLTQLYPQDDPCREALADAFEGRAGLPSPRVTRLRTQAGAWLPVLLNASVIDISGKQGTIVTAKDVRAQQAAEAELGSSRDRLHALTEHLNVGVFRADLGHKDRLLEASAATWRILGLDGAPADPDLSAILPDAEDRAAFLRRLEKQGAVQHHLVRLSRVGGENRFAAVHASLVRESGGTFCEGILTDVTEQHKLAEDRDRLLAESQSSLLPLNGPVGPNARPLTLCPHDWPVQKAAALMAKQGSGVVLVTADSGEPLGILTDGDLVRRVLAVRSDPGRPVREFMSAPVVSLPDDALLFEAGLLMHEKRLGRLVVTDAGGRCVGLIEMQDLLRIQRHSSALLLGEIARARGAEEASAAHARMPQLVRAMIEAGAEAPQVTRLVAAVSDALTARLVQLALDELGPPPCPFAFMVLGSAGRGEQTLCADQDNAIVYEHTAPGAQEYFLSLGAKVCAGLDAAGYPFCNGKVMAREPKWCRPLAEFQAMFSRWTVELGDQDLCDVNICFDFRAAAGDAHLAVELRRHVLEAVRDKPRFLFHLAETTLQFKPPVGFFGNIQVEGSGAHAEAFSIKTAVVPVVNFARIYALHHGIGATNTLERLRALRGMDVLTQTGHDEMEQSYGELMRLRLKHQAARLAEGLPPDNHINPKRLTELERMMLKRIFAHIAALQARLTTDFARTS